LPAGSTIGWPPTSGPEQIFLDIDTMKPGVDFVQRIEEAVGSCKAFVTVIGDNWLEGRDAKGGRRLDAPRDWVRQEIKVALSRPDVLVVPVLVEHATMPAEDELPASIRKLARRNAVELTDKRWDYEVGQLIATLEQVLEPRPYPPPTPPRRGGRTAAGTTLGSESEDDDPALPPPAPAPLPMPQQWAPRPMAGPALSRQWESASRPPAEPPARPRIPTWLKVVVPILVLAVLVIVPSVVLVGNVIDRVDEAKGTTTGPRGTAANSTTLPPTTPPTTPPIQATTPKPPTRVINGPFVGKSGALTLTVQKIEAGPAQTRIHLLVVNGTADELGLPTNGFSATDNTDHRYKVDVFSKWPSDVPPRGRLAEVIDIQEPLVPGARTMRVGWGTVFGSFAVKSIFVDGVRLT